MRFRTELRVVLPVVLAASAGVPAIEGCKKQNATVMDAGAGKPPIVINNNDDIPVMLGGAVAPYEPPPVVDGGPLGGLGRSSTSSPGAQAAPQAVAPRPQQGAISASDTAREGNKSSAVAIRHNHPPDQPCQPLKREEVEKALGDLRRGEKK